MHTAVALREGYIPSDVHGVCLDVSERFACSDPQTPPYWWSEDHNHTQDRRPHRSRGLPRGMVHEPLEQEATFNPSIQDLCVCTSYLAVSQVFYGTNIHTYILRIKHWYKAC